MEGNFDMKKLFSIALSMLMLISCFAISASAEEVNYAQNENASYAYIEDVSGAWNGAMTDDACELLTDGKIPYAETPFESVSIVGSNKVVTMVFDIGAIYPDVKQVKFCGVWDSNTHQSSGKNRGFSADNTIIRVSQDGVNFERNKAWNMTKENWSEDGSENGWYNFVFTFDEDVTAKAIELTFWSPVYVLSLGEIQIIGGGATPVEPESSEEEISEPEEESSEEETEEPTAADSEAESEAVSEAASEAESEAASEAASEAEKSADESKTESKAEASSEAPNDDDDGFPLVVIVIIIVAVVAVATGVVIVMKKRR